MAIKTLRPHPLHLLTWVLTRALYRVTTQGLEHIPAQGGVLLTCNHVSYMDALLLMSVCPRPIRFVIDEQYYNLPWLQPVLNMAKVIPISTESHQIRTALTQIKTMLNAGEIVCIFPEGQLTPHGALLPFKRGVNLILRQTPVPVVPMAIDGLWGSWFSRERGRAFLKAPQRMWTKIKICAAAPIVPTHACNEHLFAQISNLLARPTR